jgi:large subunit ribosomal protein L24
MQRIRKGDEVVVITGRDKGKRGTVLRRVSADYLVVEGVNRVKKHQRPNPMKGVTGGIVDKDMPIHVSNIALFNPGDAEGRPRRRQAARRRPQGARIQVERRAGRRLR